MRAGSLKDLCAQSSTESGAALATGSGASASWSGTSFYKILGVDSDATDQQIQRAYRRLASVTHPDQARTTARIEEFVAAAEAYEVLSKQRAEYDEHRRRLRARAAEQRVRERDEAERAARAARQEAEQRLRQQRPRPAPGAGGPGARAYLAWDGQSWTTSGDATFQAMLGEQIRQLAAVRGRDVEVTVVGGRTYYRDGFLIKSPDGGLVEVAARLRPGRYLVAEGRGEFAPFGGPRGNLLLTYYWPSPLPGGDAETFVSIPAREVRRAHTFVNPFDGEAFTIPKGTDAPVVWFEARGLPGEFGGPAGDLKVHVKLEGSRSRPGRTLLLVLVAALVVALVVYLLS
ncbi:hypothetical protein GCM10022197_41920 [Microlunatus spumicola]|uniref:J domain-containing protein n=1 Tax=Microlunatus spumicola TaxID=81499 RepID=A0ABP6YA37_9ACTN